MSEASRRDEHLTRGMRLGGWAVIAALLIAPLIAMQVTDSVDWGPGDFVIAALLLGVAGLIMELGLRAFPRTSKRLLLGAVVVAGLALVWAELAVGIFS